MIDIYIATMILLGIVVLVAGAFWLAQARKLKPRIRKSMSGTYWVCEDFRRYNYAAGSTPLEAYRKWKVLK